MAKFSERHQPYPPAGRNVSGIKVRLFNAFMMLIHRQQYPACRHGPQRNASTRHRLLFAWAETIEMNIEILSCFMVVYEGAIGT